MPRTKKTETTETEVTSEQAEVKTPVKTAKKTTTSSTTTRKKATTATAKSTATKKVASTEEAPKKVTPAKEEKAEVKEVAKSEEKTRTEAFAIAKGVGVTPRKARLVIDLVRGKSLEEAYNILNNVNKLAAKPVMKAIKSAAANATNNFHMNGALLYVATIYANDGPKLRRYLPRAKGSASGLVKRWCSITVIVKEREVK